MEKLYLERRPVSSCLRGLAIWFVLAALLEISCGAGAAAGGHANFLLPASGLTTILVTVLAFIIRGELVYKRDLPEKIEEFLNKELSVKDYTAVYKYARKYHAIRPMVADAMCNGKLCYREAENLAEQINAYLADHGRGHHSRSGSSKQRLKELAVRKHDQ